MLTRTNIVWVIVVLVATWAMPGVAVAQKAAVPKPQDKLALGENEVKQLLLLIDTDESGKISKRSSTDWIRTRKGSWTRRN